MKKTERQGPRKALMIVLIVILGINLVIGAILFAFPNVITSIIDMVNTKRLDNQQLTEMCSQTNYTATADLNQPELLQDILLNRISDKTGQYVEEDGTVHFSHFGLCLNIYAVSQEEVYYEMEVYYHYDQRESVYKMLMDREGKYTCENGAIYSIANVVNMLDTLRQDMPELKFKSNDSFRDYDYVYMEEEGTDLLDETIFYGLKLTESGELREATYRKSGNPLTRCAVTFTFSDYGTTQKPSMQMW